MQVEEKAMEVSWNDVLPDKSDMDERLVSEPTTLVSLSMASLRLLSLAGTTVLGVLVSVPLLDAQLSSAGLSSTFVSSCIFMLGSKSSEKSPVVKTYYCSLTELYHHHDRCILRQQMQPEHHNIKLFISIMKDFMQKGCMSLLGPSFIFCRIKLILMDWLVLTWETSFCNCFCWFALCFWELTYSKNSVFQTASFGDLLLDEKWKKLWFPFLVSCWRKERMLTDFPKTHGQLMSRNAG